MLLTSHQPILELTRGKTTESIHFGSVAVVDIYGHLVAKYGDPGCITFMRSSAKPLQALPLLEMGGKEEFDLSLPEIALICSSHSGTEVQVQALEQLQAKINISENQLLCGTHPPYHKPSAEYLERHSLEPTPNHHNCSGNHTGMLAYARLMAKRDPSTASDLSYTNMNHPIQQDILHAVAEMCEIPVDHIQLGTDGCSIPNYALPLERAAFAFARLCDPDGGAVKPAARGVACVEIVSAMTLNPDMVAGPGRFDTCLMEITGGRMVSKGGAEGYQAVGLMPGAIGQDSPAMGVIVKISDGDQRGTVKSAVTLEVLRQLGALSASDLTSLDEFGPIKTLSNWRKITTGEMHPIFSLHT